MFTEEDSKRQDEAIAQLVEEFDQLQKQEENLRKMAVESNRGVDPTVAIEDLPPEFRAQLEESKAKAAREGAARAEQFKRGMQTHRAGSVSAQPGSRRSGVIRI